MLKLIFATFVAALSLGAWAAPGDPVKVVYHMNEDVQRAPQALRNVRNHLSVDPKAKIVMVMHAAGINFLMRDAKDANGNPFEVTVQDLKSQGVEFRVCEITLKQRKIDRKQLIDEVVYVPSGVAEVSRLQSQEGFAYLKP
ncbi:MAG TPA: DsrE family protein [Usitatibacter sp.]|nr:DsrE family protein [Usitatibacter sp.]